jgi:hypothetical protein
MKKVRNKAEQFVDLTGGKVLLAGLKGLNMLRLKKMYYGRLSGLIDYDGVDSSVETALGEAVSELRCVCRSYELHGQMKKAERPLVILV